MLNAAPGEMLADRTAKTCSRCGGPLELRHLQGMEVEVCVRCGAAVLDRADLESLAASAVMSAPEARAEAGPPRPAATPARPERKKPWDFTPRPAPPRMPPKRMEKTLIPTLAEEGADDETEDGPMVVGTRIHQSEPPVRPREALPDSELPTGPPTPAPVPKSSRSPVPKATAPSGPGPGGAPRFDPKGGPPPLTLKAEPSFRVGGGAPTPPPTLGRTVRPEDGNAPLVRPAGAVTMSSEPDIGSLPPGPIGGPGIDLGEPEPSTEEAPRVVSSGDLSPWADRDESGEWEAGRSRVRTFLFAASALAAVGALAALVALAVWVTWLGPRWRERVATADGPELAQIMGTPTGDVVVEHPEPVDPGEDGVPVEPVEPPTPEPVEVAVAPIPDPVPEPVVEPTPAPAPPPAASSRKTLIAKGWDAVESDPDTALAAFGQVLETNPSDYEAAYGYGYALLEKGDAAGAGPYLCRARPSPDVTIQREVDGLLARHGITCP